MTRHTVPQIIQAVAAYFEITPEELTGAARDAQACSRRAVAYHLCIELTDVSKLKIGEAFGGRDHTSVQAGLKRKMPYVYLEAISLIRRDLEPDSLTPLQIVRRWPFRSRRVPPPMFIRRHTA